MASLAPYAAAAVALTVLSACCVTARLFVRLTFVKNFGVDDCLIVLALAASIALTVVTAKGESKSFFSSMSLLNPRSKFRYSPRQ